MLNESAPISPVSVDVLSILRTPALDSVSFGGMLGGGDLTAVRDAPVVPETLLARLLRPLTLETLSVEGIVPPFQACSERETKTKTCYPNEQEDQKTGEKCDVVWWVVGRETRRRGMERKSLLMEGRGKYGPAMKSCHSPGAHLRAIWSSAVAMSFTCTDEPDLPCHSIDQSHCARS